MDNATIDAVIVVIEAQIGRLRSRQTWERSALRAAISNIQSLRP